MKKMLLKGVLLLCVLMPVGALASPYSEMIVFGDSLSDSGNIYALTAGTIPGSPYYQGRFSNGPNYVDYLASRLGLEVDPYLEDGTNYAFGGAMVDSGGPEPDLKAQVDLFAFQVDIGLVDPDENALYVVYAGGNDLLDAIGEASSDPGNAGPIGQNALNRIIEDIRQVLDDLEDLGARHILVPNLPNMARVPRVLEREANVPGITAFAQSLTIIFNQTLASVLDSFPNVNIIRLDTYSITEDVVNNPGAYGLSDVTTYCYTGDDDYQGGGTICPNPDAFLFWDRRHPTTVAHNILANKAFQALAGVRADIKANGQDGPVIVSESTAVSITVTLNAGTIPGQNADWWIVADTPFGFYSHVCPFGQFCPEPWLSGIGPFMQSPLFNVDAPYQVFNNTLPAGDYWFYFAVDDNANGIAEGTWLDWVAVSVQ